MFVIFSLFPFDYPQTFDPAYTDDADTTCTYVDE